MQTHALLQWRSGTVFAPAETEMRPQSKEPFWRPGVSRRVQWFVSAALLMVLVGGMAVMSGVWKKPDFAPHAPITEVAVVLDVGNVSWRPGQSPLAAGARVATGQMGIDSGTLRLQFDSGAVLTIHGPAEANIIDSQRVRIVQGKVTLRRSAARGFTVETPDADVIDWGTEFGVEVKDAAQTDVVVFEGAVDVCPKKADSSEKAAPKRLSKGEAVRIGGKGRFSRVQSVERQPNGAWSIDGDRPVDALITSVSDNMGDSSNYYQIVPRGLREDTKAYVDRSYEWNGADAAGMDGSLLGADLVMTFNNDKRAQGLKLTVALDRAAVLYVFYEERGETPAWLERDFRRTSLSHRSR